MKFSWKNLTRKRCYQILIGFLVLDILVAGYGAAQKFIQASQTKSRLSGYELENQEKQENLASMARDLTGLSQDMGNEELFMTMTDRAGDRSVTLTVDGSRGDDSYVFYQLPPQTLRQTLSYAIELPGGGLVMIDGGYNGDSDYLRQFILEHGGVVDAWILTDPMEDHIGAVLELAGEDSGITIKTVYYPYFSWDFFTGEKEGKDLTAINDGSLYGEMWDFCNKTEGISFVEVNPGDSWEIEGITIDCIGGYDGEIYDVGNNSLILRMDINGYVLMMCGDIGAERLMAMLEEMPKDSPVWKADAVRLPGHGIYGVAELWLDLTQPDLVFLDCNLPQYNNKDNNYPEGRAEYDIEENRSLLYSMDISSLKAFSGPNRIVIH